MYTRGHTMTIIRAKAQALGMDDNDRYDFASQVLQMDRDEIESFAQFEDDELRRLLDGFVGFETIRTLQIQKGVYQEQAIDFATRIGYRKLGSDADVPPVS